MLTLLVWFTVGKNVLKTQAAPRKLPLTWDVCVGSGAYVCRHLRNWGAWGKGNWESLGSRHSLDLFTEMTWVKLLLRIRRAWFSTKITPGDNRIPVMAGQYVQVLIHSLKKLQGSHPMVLVLSLWINQEPLVQVLQ